MAQEVRTGDLYYNDLLNLWRQNNQAQIILANTGIAWTVFKSQDVPFFISVDRDDPKWIVPNTDGRWHKIYGYTPKEEQL